MFVQGLQVGGHSAPRLSSGGLRVGSHGIEWAPGGVVSGCCAGRAGFTQTFVKLWQTNSIPAACFRVAFYPCVSKLVTHLGYALCYSLSCPL